jgi:hypothetical protein
LVATIGKLVTIALVVVAALAIAATGCGASEGSDEEVVVVQGANYAAPAVSEVRAVRRCLRESGMGVRKTVKDEWSLRIVGVLPAEEVGFAALPGGGAVDIWLTISSKEAKRVAELANRKHRDHTVGTARNNAEAHGSGVTSIVVSSQPVVRSEVMQVYRCLKQ